MVICCLVVVIQGEQVEKIKVLVLLPLVVSILSWLAVTPFVVDNVFA